MKTDHGPARRNPDPLPRNPIATDTVPDAVRIAICSLKGLVPETDPRDSNWMSAPNTIQGDQSDILCLRLDSRLVTLSFADELPIMTFLAESGIP